MINVVAQSPYPGRSVHLLPTRMTKYNNKYDNVRIRHTVSIHVQTLVQYHVLIYRNNTDISTVMYYHSGPDCTKPHTSM